MYDRRRSGHREEEIPGEMILHLLSDPDFFNPVIHQFEAAGPGLHCYGVFEEKHYIRLKDSGIQAKVILISAGEAQKVLNEQNINSILVHCMTIRSAEFLLTIPSGIRVFWSIFGIDLYGFYPGLQAWQYDRLTRRHVYSGNFFLRTRYFLKARIQFLLRNETSTIKKAIRKVSLFSTVIPDEKALVENRLPTGAEFCKLDVGHLPFIDEKFMHDDLSQSKTKGSIYVGTSASVSCNHLEVIDALKKLDDSSAEVSFQLSYGGEESYKDYLKEQADRNLKCEVNTIREWMSKEDFLKLTRSQAIFIFNSVRQQGVGAILTAIWFGAKVFLNPRSPVYTYYKSIGLTVYSLPELTAQTPGWLFELLSENEVLKNRKILLSVYSGQNVLLRTQTVIRKMTS